MTALVFELFEVFFLIGLLTFGGGYAVIGIIQSEVVTGRGWISQGTFTDIVAISQMTPGPVGLNCSTYVGYEVLREAGAGQFVSCLGSLAASLAIVLPSFLIMLFIVKFYAKFRTTRTFRTMMDSLKPTVAGLIAASAFAMILTFKFGEGWSIVTENFSCWKSWVVFIAAGTAYLSGKAGPVVILGAGALLGILLF